MGVVGSDMLRVVAGFELLHDGHRLLAVKHLLIAAQIREPNGRFERAVALGFFAGATYGQDTLVSDSRTRARLSELFMAGNPPVIRL
jgi:hypothetical protein